MRYLLFTFILLFSLSACGDNEQKAIQDAQKAKLEKEALLSELKAKDDALHKARLETQAAQKKLIVQEQAKKEAFIKEQAEKARQAKHATQNAKLSKVGITIEENLITIDTNKTKDFFETIGKQLGDKLKKITTQIEDGIVDEKEVGVQIDETHINIDLNKTKDFLEDWGKKMQGFIKEFDTVANEIDKEIKQLENNHLKGN